MRNIVFDMGNVLINYDPVWFVERLGPLPEGDRALLLREIFHSPDWPRLDAGEIREADLEAAALARLPERLHAAARRLIYRWEEPSEPVPGMAEFIRACKGRGFGIYLLSNASLRQKDYWPGIPGSECFDGRVVSAEERCVKPDPRIYRILLERYGLRAEECLFVDDVPANVEGARARGMEAFLFTGDVGALRRAVL